MISNYIADCFSISHISTITFQDINGLIFVVNLISYFI